MEIADYTFTERREWKRVKPQDQLVAPMTYRKRCAITLTAAKQLKQAILDGKATPPTCSFNRGGFDADRLPKRQNRAQA
jgi:hypothetical protein